MIDPNAPSELAAATIASHLQGAISTPLRMVVQFGECVIAIKTNDQRLIDDLTHYYSPYLSQVTTADFEVTAIESAPLTSPIPLEPKTPDPGKSKIKEEFVNLSDGRLVRKRLTGLLLVFGGTSNLAIGPVVANANQIINFVNNRYIQYLLDQRALLFHAAAARINGMGIAICGFSGMGKSTLSLKLMSAGATFVSNDRLLALRENERLQMFGVAKLPRINPGTILNNPDLRSMITSEQKTRYQSLPPDQLWQLEEKFDAFIDQIWGKGRITLASPFDLLVILNWRRAGEPLRISPVSLSQRHDLIPAFAKEPGLFYLSDTLAPAHAAPADQYLQLLGDCQVVECSGTADFDAAAEQIVHLTKSRAAERVN